MNRTIRWAAVAVSVVYGLVISATATGQPLQLLDRVQAFDDEAVLDMYFDKLSTERPPNFEVAINSSGSDFTACKLTATLGMFCLDGSVVRHWPTATDGGGTSVIVDCADATLGLKACTGLTVDLGGTIWLAGQDKGKTHNLFRIKLEPPGPCSSGSRLALSSDYCAILWAKDKPLLVDLNSIDGDTAAGFVYGATPPAAEDRRGVLALEERKTAVFFPAAQGAAAYEIASGKTQWTLAGNEQLFSAALLQYVNPVTLALENYVLATTSNNRILAAETDGTPNVIQVFDIDVMRDPGSVQCDFEDPASGIRTSPKSGLTYVSDRQYCEVLALVPTTDATSGKLVGLANADDDGAPLTLSTNDTPGTFPVRGPTIAPGEAIDLRACGSSCTMVTTAAGAPGATMSGVSVIGDKDGMTLFQIEGVPDCRHIPLVCVGLLDNVASEADLITEGIILDPHGLGNPSAQLLNVTPLLPLEVTESVDIDLPPMWISHWYEAQQEKGYFFNAFFGYTDATFEGVFEIEIEVRELTGQARECIDPAAPEHTAVETLIAGHDVAVKVSEDYHSIERNYIPGGSDHETMLINVGCGSLRGNAERWSLMPFDLGFNEDTYDPTDPGPGSVTTNDDAVFAKLLRSLYDDLDESINTLACVAADGQASAPMSPTDCAEFNSRLANTLHKLDKCIEATKVPKESAGNENCGSYESQSQHLSDFLDAVVPGGDDPANRIGESQARNGVIGFVYGNLFYPSIPEDGFNDL